VKSVLNSLDDPMFWSFSATSRLKSSKFGSTILGYCFGGPFLNGHFNSITQKKEKSVLLCERHHSRTRLFGETHAQHGKWNSCIQYLVKNLLSFDICDWKLHVSIAVHFTKSIILFSVKVLRDNIYSSSDMEKKKQFITVSTSDFKACNFWRSHTSAFCVWILV
jgi:hypothetical protein